MAESTIRTSVDRFIESTFLESANTTLHEYIEFQRETKGISTIKRDKARTKESEGGNTFEISITVFNDEKEGKMLGAVMLEPMNGKRKEKEMINHFKTSLICSLSHELCTPMNSLMPLLRLIPVIPTKDGKEDLKEIVISSAELLYSKIRDLVDYNKIEMEGLTLEDSEFSVWDLFLELKQIFKYEALHKDNHLEFNVQLSERRKLMIYTDKARIKQVLVKLIFNANKYTSKGRIEVIAKENEKNLDVEFVVHDTGVGMNKSTLSFIFSSLHEKARFLCSQQTESTKLPGLGLWIAKSICEALGSVLKVESLEVKGTTFSFTVPTCRVFETLSITTEDGLPPEENLEDAPHRGNSLGFHKKRGSSSSIARTRNLQQEIFKPIIYRIEAYRSISHKKGEPRQRSKNQADAPKTPPPKPTSMKPPLGSKEADELKQGLTKKVPFNPTIVRRETGWPVLDNCKPSILKKTEATNSNSNRKPSFLDKIEAANPVIVKTEPVIEAAAVTVEKKQYLNVVQLEDDKNGEAELVIKRSSTLWKGPERVKPEIPPKKPRREHSSEALTVALAGLNGFRSKEFQRKKSLRDVVLVVDDVYGNRVVLREMLKKLGICALEAENGSDAVDLLKAHLSKKSRDNIKLIFMDLNMPILDGIQATVAIRDIERKKTRSQMIPIIAVTANNNEEDKKKCFAVGMQDYIAKPVTFGRLIDVVERFLKIQSGDVTL